MRNIHFNPFTSLPVQRSRVKSLTRCVLAGLIVLFSFAAGAQTTRYVNANASGANNGSSWANAYTDLQVALGASTSGDSLFVAAGTYTPSTSGLTDPRMATFSIPAGVLVYGGFAGDEANLAARDLSAGHETILSGDLGTAIAMLGNFDDTGYNDNSYHVVSMTNTDALLDGFTIQGGNANGSDSPNDSGGGIYVTAAGTLRNITVRYNTSSINGGGIFLRNESTGQLTAVNCMVYDNKANQRAGGMYLENKGTGTITAINCMVYDNEATWGGGMNLQNMSTGMLAAVNCTVYNNEANTNGGGMLLRNHAVGKLTAVNCTVYDNKAEGDGGGISLWNQSTGGPLTVANSIIFGNTAPTGPDVYRSTSGTAATLTNCLLGQAGAGGMLTITNPVGMANANPALVTGDPRFASRNPNKSVFLRLMVTSPALDAGDNSRVPTDVMTDIAGNVRIQDGNGDNTATVDVGAYEGVFVPLLQRYYVDANASGGNDGTNWANAYTNLQDALGQVDMGDSLFVAAGTYTPSTTGLTEPREATFGIPEGVLVYGGFAGSEANLAVRDLSLGNETILSGDLGTTITTLGDFGDAGYNDNSYHVVSMPNADALLDGFTIQGGNANSSSPDNNGGGIYVTKAGTLRNLTIRYNTSNNNGGGMYLENESTGPLTAVNCTAYNNNATSQGGGMFLRNENTGPLTAVNCTVYNNKAEGDGGGMFLENESTGTLTSENCTVYDNKADFGGGMLIWNIGNGTLTAANCTVYDNEATDSGGGCILKMKAPARSPLSIA